MAPARVYLLAAADMPPFEFSIPVHDLDAAGKAFRFPVRAAWVRGALEATNVSPTSSDGEIDVRVSKSGNDVVIHGTLRYDLTVPCARCLEPAHVSVRETLSTLAVAGAPSKGGGKHHDDSDGEDADLAIDDANTIPYDGDTVVLDDLVRDEILLGIPMIPLCSDDCPGIRLEPAAVEDAVARDEDDVDPRLQPLQRLRKT